MRLWSVHPSLLDSRGLVAAWREGLLAQKVLLGETRGYRHHPQLVRFLAGDDPVAAIGCWLRILHAEATARGYRFDATRIACAMRPIRMRVTDGQLQYEWNLLLRKVASRDLAWLARLRSMGGPQSHPMFFVVKGAVENWERPKPL